MTSDIVKRMKDAADRAIDTKAYFDDPKEEEAFILSTVMSRNTLHGLLCKFADAEDMDNVNLILDAIGMDQKYKKALEIIPPDMLNEIREHVKERTGKTDE